MEYITTKEVAEKLGVSLRRVQAMITSGRLPATKVGRDYLIRERDLKLVENRKVGRPKKDSK
jgi:excisionase family DNA binding protein